MKALWKIGLGSMVKREIDCCFLLIRACLFSGYRELKVNHTHEKRVGLLCDVAGNTVDDSSKVERNSRCTCPFFTKSSYQQTELPPKLFPLITLSTDLTGT